MNIYSFVHGGIHPFVVDSVKHLTFEYKELIPKFSHVSFYEVYILFSYFIQYVFYLYAFLTNGGRGARKGSFNGKNLEADKTHFSIYKEYHPL